MAIVPVRDVTSSLHNSVNISDNEAVHEQRKLLEHWTPKSEVWWLKHGEKIIGGICAANGLLINSMFRHKLKLHSQGRMLSILCALSGPGILGTFSFRTLITDNILLYKHECPVCYEIKANAVTTTGSMVFPLLTMPMLNLAMAASVGLRVPYLYEVRELARFFWSVLKPGITHLSLFLALNNIAASLVTYKQMVAAETVADTLFKIEKYLQKKESNKLLA